MCARCIRVIMMDETCKICGYGLGLSRSDTCSRCASMSHERRLTLKAHLELAEAVRKLTRALERRTDRTEEEYE